MQRPELVRLTCAECERSFDRTAASQRHKRARTPDALDFCSRECALRSPLVRRLWSERRRDYWADPDRRHRASALRIAQMAAGIAPAVSRTEDAVAGALAAFGITFRRQVEIRHPETGRAIACVDFLLPGGRVLEVYGSFWHCDPRHYPQGPVVPIQDRVRRADARKRRAFAALGIPTAVVWEHDVLADVGRAVAAALSSLPAEGAVWLWPAAAAQPPASGRSRAAPSCAVP